MTLCVLGLVQSREPGSGAIVPPEGTCNLGDRSLGLMSLDLPAGTIQFTEIVREDVMREVHLEKMMKGQAQPLSGVEWGEKGNPTISYYPCAKGGC